MNGYLFARGIAAALGLVGACVASADIIVTEIHYNPNGSENQDQEWIEIYNKGTTTQDLSGWDWGDSQDVQFTGNFPAGTSLAAGASAILVRQSPTNFRTAWGRNTIQVIQTDVGISLGNTGSATNETVVIRDANDVIIDAVNYETSTNGWPGTSNQSTIYLKPNAIDALLNDVGSNWAQSAVGTDGAFQAAALNPDIANATLLDIGSPGTVVDNTTSVPEPTSFALLGLVAAGMGTRRRARPAERIKIVGSTRIILRIFTRVH